MESIGSTQRNLKESVAGICYVKSSSCYGLEPEERPEEFMVKIRTIGPISVKIGVAFLLPGVLSLILSIFFSSQILAFVGLGLTFWGALFLLIRPMRYVEGSLLGSTTTSLYSTIDRLIKDYGYKGDGYYIPPYPKDVYLPDHLKGLKDTVIFVSATNDTNMPSIEQLAEGKFLLENPKGALVIPPGSGLLSQIEKASNIDFAKTQLNELCEILPRFILENFGLAKEMEMAPGDGQVYLKTLDSLYKNLYSRESNLKSIGLIGCPLVSAVACAIAKASGKAVTIQKQKVSPDGSEIEVWYRIVQG